MANECHVSGKWHVKQSNGYTPVFALEETGGTVTGSATLSSADQARANLSSPTGHIKGTLNCGRLDIRVEWAPKNDGARSLGHYIGTVAGNQIVDGFDRDELNPAYKGSWTATRND